MNRLFKGAAFLRAVIAVAVIALLCTVPLSGCKSQDTVTAMQTAHQVSFASVDTILKMEEVHRAALPPDVTEAADKLRAAAPAFFEAWWSLIDAYRAWQASGEPAQAPAPPPAAGAEAPLGPPGNFGGLN